MLATAKVFSSGNSQAVRLPKAFRVDATEMWISKNEATGEITLKPKDDPGRKQRIRELTRMIEEDPFTGDWIPERAIDPPRDPFADWEPLPDGQSGEAGGEKPSSRTCWTPTS